MQWCFLFEDDIIEFNCTPLITPFFACWYTFWDAKLKQNVGFSILHKLSQIRCFLLHKLRNLEGGDTFFAPEPNQNLQLDSLFSGENCVGFL